jgi:hypothetical protein
MKNDININRDNLKKFITFDIESFTDLDSLKKDGDLTYFDPVIISAHDFYHDVIFTEILRRNLGEKEQIPLFEKDLISYNDKEMRLEKIMLLAEFFLNFIQPKYNKFILYAHNLSNFDGIFILESLLYISENYNLKIEPLIRDNYFN